MAEDVWSFFRAVFLVRCRLLGRWEPPKARQTSPFFLFFHACQEWDGCGGSAGWDVPPRRVGRPSRRLGRWLGGRSRVFFWEGFPLFSVPARRRLGGRAAGAFFVVRLFFLGFCVARGGPPPPSAGGRRSSTPPRRVFSPSFFLFFPLAWQGRARVELAVKARSSSLGCRPFFSLSGREAQRRGDPCLRGGGTGAGPRTGEGATLFFFGVGRDPSRCAPPGGRPRAPSGGRAPPGSSVDR